MQLTSRDCRDVMKQACRGGKHDQANAIGQFAEPGKVCISRAHTAHRLDMECNRGQHCLCNLAAVQKLQIGPWKCVAPQLWSQVLNPAALQAHHRCWPGYLPMSGTTLSNTSLASQALRSLAWSRSHASRFSHVLAFLNGFFIILRHLKAWFNHSLRGSYDPFRGSWYQ